MTALKSDNKLFAYMNQNFIIRVLENPHENQSKKTKLTTAKKLSNYLQDDELKIRLFHDVLDSGKDKYTRLIRKRLKIEFSSK